MRELFPPVVKQQREQISLSAPHFSFSIHTTKRFPFFHVVKCCRYTTTATISNIPRKQRGPAPLRCCSNTVSALFSCVQ